MGGDDWGRWGTHDALNFREEYTTWQRKILRLSTGH